MLRYTVATAVRPDNFCSKVKLTLVVTLQQHDASGGFLWLSSLFIAYLLSSLWSRARDASIASTDGRECSRTALRTASRHGRSM